MTKMKMWGLWPISLENIPVKTHGTYQMVMATVAATSSDHARAYAKEHSIYDIDWTDRSMIEVKEIAVFGEIPPEGWVSYSAINA
jgi:hypothetical protein